LEFSDINEVRVTKVTTQKLAGANSKNSFYLFLFAILLPGIFIVIIKRKKLGAFLFSKKLKTFS